MIWNKIQNIYIHTHTYIHFNNTCIHTYKWIVHCIWKNTCKKAIVNGALITELLSSKFQHTTTYIHTLSWIHAWCVDMFYFDFDNFVFLLLSLWNLSRLVFKFPFVFQFIFLPKRVSTMMAFSYVFRKTKRKRKFRPTLRVTDIEFSFRRILRISMKCVQKWTQYWPIMFFEWKL